MTLYLFFGDDTKQDCDRPGLNRLVGFGGFRIEASKLPVWMDQMASIFQQYRVPGDAELKWSPTRKDWIWGNLKESRAPCFADLLKSLRDAGGEVVVVGKDLGRTGESEQDALESSVTYCFERVGAKLPDGAKVMFFCDRPSGGRPDEHAFLERFLARCEDGTKYSDGESVLSSIMTTNSRYNRPLQIADIIVGAVIRRAGGPCHYAEQCLEEIRPMFLRKANSGAAGGLGLKLFPDDLVNLYHHVAGDDVYQRHNSGWELPIAGRPFCKDSVKQVQIKNK